jgi:hypothetical protein
MKGRIVDAVGFRSVGMLFFVPLRADQYSQKRPRHNVVDVNQPVDRVPALS